MFISIYIFLIVQKARTLFSTDARVTKGPGSDQMPRKMCSIWSVPALSAPQ